MAENTNTAVAVKTKDISTNVLNKVNKFMETGELRLPKDYSPENALKSAFLILSEQQNSSNKPVLEVCTQESIAQTMFNLVVSGLSAAKKQCYFIPYGNQLKLSVSYLGNIALAKRFGGLKEISARAIFEVDDFQFEIDPATGKTKLIKHVQTLASLGSKNVLGAYAMVELQDGKTYLEVMSMEQIKASWNQGAAKGNSPAHRNFPDEMAKKTVINRVCKTIFGTSDDSALFEGTILDTENDDTIDIVAEEVSHEVKQNANKTEISMEVEDANIVDDSIETQLKHTALEPASEELFAETAEEGPGF